ncbi:MAG: polyhydroxybutyrate depolymerase [Proteobacteria bacterium SG_bin9]|nr:MAG: polyhydroxybutyrate depolymerase [Proteobacteria bacterium SG_bin9]
MLRLLAAALTLASVAAPAHGDELTIDGVKRTYSVQIAAKRPAPLVLALHGNTQQGSDVESRTAWPIVARRENFTVVFPDGLNRAWADLRGSGPRAGYRPPAGTDDIAFLMAIVDKLVKDGVADPRKIYATGLSNGGAMALSLACQHPEKLAAVAPTIINMTDLFGAACKPAQPIPVLLMNGTEDPLIPYKGGLGTSRFAVPGFWSTAQTIAFWRKINQCETKDASATDLPDKDKDDQSTVTRITSQCPAGQDVVLYRINGGGHRLPGGFPDAMAARLVGAMLGPQNRDIDGAETIWAFFKNYSR